MGTSVTTTATAAARQRRIYEVVAAIPRGRVASYGEVAARAGLPRGARLVGRALAECPATLPWHRVLGASGRISLPPGTAAFREQRRRLEREGVPVAANGRVAAAHFERTGADLDELLWGPPPPSRAPRRALPAPSGTRRAATRARRAP